MLCPTCGRDNRDNAQFCRACGASFRPSCAQCGQPLALDDAFCDACETSVSGPADVTLERDSPARPASDSLPAFFGDGRYVVKDFLGEGAKKRVYLAHDTLLDRDIAFALIKTEGLDETGRRRILREAQAMGRLGEHPNIVQLYDLGDEGGQPYMVLPAMSGRDAALVQRSPDHRPALNQTISIAKDVARGFEFAHSQGIVHRDLKPGNVWLSLDGTAKIGDFGLAVVVDHSRLTQEGMMVGTASYMSPMSPEQAMGGSIDERSDLYSLGAMLYEMVAGRPPFLGEGPLAIVGQHVNTRPVTPTWHNPECPKPLEAMILRLLAKDPTERPQSARDVLTALESIDVSANVEGATIVEEGANALDGLVGGVFVGRQREMGELKAALGVCLSIL